MFHICMYTDQPCYGICSQCCTNISCLWRLNASNESIWAKGSMHFFMYICLVCKYRDFLVFVVVIGYRIRFVVYLPQSHSNFALIFICHNLCRKTPQAIWLKWLGLDLWVLTLKCLLLECFIVCQLYERN